jgi:hypothetical protein
MRISDTREHFEFVSTHATKFNHVATTFLQVLKRHWEGIPPKALAQALKTLQEKMKTIEWRAETI